MRGHSGVARVLLPALCALLLSAAACGASLRDAPLASASPPLYLDSPACVWSANESSLGLSIPATVPGDIITDLQRAGVIGDPYYELSWLDNLTLWDVSMRAWHFSTAVQLPPPGAPPRKWGVPSGKSWTSRCPPC